MILCLLSRLFPIRIVIYIERGETTEMHSSQFTRYRMSVMSSRGGPAAAAAAAAAAEEILIDVEEEEKEEEKYCFCFETEATNGPYFQLDDCPHRLHKKCLRDILRHQWSSSAARSKVVDTEHRKVAFMMCPYCRAPLSPEVLRKLQKESKIISINEIITEKGHTNLSGRHRCCCNYQYDILVKTETAEDTKLVTFQSYSAKNLPVMQHQEQQKNDEIRFLLYQDFAVECESPLSSFTVTIRKTEPEYKIIKHFQVISKNLPSTEVDAGEEAESQRSIERCLQNNSLRIITPEIQQRDFENAVLAENLRRNMTTPQFTDPPPLLSPQNIRRNRRNHPILESLLADETYSSPSSSPPLPSLEDLFETHEETTSTQQQPTVANSSTGYSPASPDAYYYSNESSVTDEMNTFSPTTTTTTTAAAAYDGSSPVSPSYSPESPTPRYPTPENRPVNAGYSPMSPRYTPVSPSYQPPSENRPTTAVVGTAGTGNRYSPMSPCYSPPPSSPPTHRPPQRSSTVTVTNVSPECATPEYTVITLAEQHHNSSCSISLLNHSSLRQPIKTPSHTVRMPQPSIPSSSSSGSSSSSSSNIAGPSNHQTTSPYFSTSSSKMPTDPRLQQKKRQKKTDEEKMKECKHTLTSKISKLKLRVKASIYSTKTKLEALHKNIQKYHDTEQQIYQFSSSSSSYINSVSRMRIKLEKEKITKTLNDLYFHINSLNQYF